MEPGRYEDVQTAPGPPAGWPLTPLGEGGGERRTQPAPPGDASVHEAVAEWAGRTPGAVAVAAAGGARLTYAALEARAAALAAALRARGVGPEGRVALLLDRSPALVVAMLAALQAGGAYLPLDPAAPPDRLAFLLADAGARVVLTDGALHRALPAPLPDGITLLRVDAEGEWAEASADAPDSPPQDSAEAAEAGASPGAERLAYVMYTSGSTGTPKAVMVPHRAIVRLVCGADYVQLTPADVVAHVANPAFDATTFEVWGALMNGARIVVIDRETALSPSSLAAALRAHGVTTLFLTTALFNLVAREQPDAFATLTHLLFGGEQVDPDCVRRVVEAGPPKRLLHVYGPTETTTFATWHRVEAAPAEGATVPIGHAIAGTRAYVLDVGFQPTPIGVAGELYIGGAGVARGYWGRGAPTAERFLPDPFSGTPGARLYRTGDRARWRPDGTVEFLGRLDGQVKIRGHRIEPAEIVAALSRHPAVRECAVVAREDAGERRLVAYVVPRAGEATPEARELRTFLARSLPEYMFPAAVVSLATLPLTPNGKLDRAALPAPPPSAAPGEAPPAEPRDPLESRLLAIWKEVLRLPRVGVHDDFFAVGGHSLLAARLFAEIRRQLGRQLPIAALFRAPTVAQLAVVMREADGMVDDWRPVVVLQRGSGSHADRPPLFLIHGAGGNVLGYRDLALSLGPDQTVYAVQSAGLDGSRPPNTRVEDIAAEYIREVRGVQPDGPYFLGGMSFGGVVAFEMARQLEAQGCEVALVALVDSAPPREAFARERRGTPSWEWWRLTARRAAYHATQLLRLPAKGKLAYVQAKAKTVRRRVTSRMWQHRFAEYERRAQPLPQELWSVMEANTLAYRKYRGAPYEGRVTLFRAQERGLEGVRDPSLGWQRWAAGGVEVYDVPGDHLTCLSPAHVSVLGARLRQCIDEAAARARGATA